MSIGSLGVIGSVTAGQLQQSRGADADRAVQDSRSQSRAAETGQQAEAAEGVGEMAEDEESSDRDADGRRLWEPPAKRPPPDDSDPNLLDESPHSVDPTGQAGGQLDLLG